MHVSATDKATGKEQKIEIKAGSGLSDDEISTMVNAADSHAEDDRKFRELVDTRNQADGMVHATRSSLKELGDKIGDDDRKKVEDAIASVETAIEGNDKEAIDSCITARTEAAQGILVCAVGIALPWVLPARFSEAVEEVILRVGGPDSFD